MLLKRIVYGLPAAVLLAALGIYAAYAARPASKTGDPPAAARQSILLELFTSEGCSSCPPADRLLESFDRNQSVAGAQLIVLSEHVDYWNRLGWADPFSSALFTQRQQDYVRQLRLADAYTPQLVIDGQQDVVGSDEQAVRAAILKAEAHPKAAIELRAEPLGKDAKIELSVKAAPAGADVFVALAQDHTQSHVTRGENSGRILRHVAVVRTLLPVGKTDAQGAFARNLTLALKDDNGGGWRVVVFLRDARSGHIVGAAETRL